MIVDTSAFVAIVYDEPDNQPLRLAIAAGGIVPAPVLIEFRRVVTQRGSRPAPAEEEVFRQLL
ncbi:MAG: hypothetical protein QOI38_2857, partial [Sphingomonadales bacterium]|nr:hypothetical protein [Sphingomonadales bacterium]